MHIVRVCVCVCVCMQSMLYRDSVCAVHEGTDSNFCTRLSEFLAILLFFSLLFIIIIMHRLFRISDNPSLPTPSPGTHYNTFFLKAREQARQDAAAASVQDRGRYEWG